MKNFRSIGLMLVFVASLLVGCTSDNVMTGSSQVENQEVVFNLFEHSISDIGTRGDGSGNKALADCGLFSELEVALIPDGGTMKSEYVVRQDDAMDNFGQVKMYVPEGTYHLIVVAANTPKPIGKSRVEIKSVTEVVFPNNSVPDMAYCYKDITIASSGKSHSFDCVLKRAVAAFKIQTTDKITENLKNFSIKMSGNCGNVLNPSTGHCSSKAAVNKDFDLAKYVGKALGLTFYVIPGEDEVEDVSVTVDVFDKNDKVIKSNSFSNVHLVTGKRTTYTGPFSSYTTGFSINVGEADIVDSGYGKEFE